MENFFSKAAKNFVHSVGGNFGKCNNPPKEGYVSKIEIDGDIKKSIYILVPRETLDTLSMLLFGEKEYDLQGLINEMANLIVGNAKVVAAEENVHFNISIPEFLDVKNVKYEKREDYSIDNECFSILY